MVFFLGLRQVEHHGCLVAVGWLMDPMNQGCSNSGVNPSLVFSMTGPVFPFEILPRHPGTREPCRYTASFHFRFPFFQGVHYDRGLGSSHFYIHFDLESSLPAHGFSLSSSKNGDLT